MKKKSFNTLKALRVTLAMLIFIPVLLYFIDFRDMLPDSLSALLKIQLVPAVFTGSVVILATLFLLTLLFGRVYCSVLCPAGVLQDIFERIGRIGRSKKNGKYRFRSLKAYSILRYNILRYGILAVTVLLVVFGITEFVLLLDPYSNFGRISSCLFRPAVVWINNLLASVFASAGNYTLYNVTISIPTGALIAAIIAFAVFAVMVWFKGRMFCNVICPVGSLLSLVSRYSFFRIMFDKSLCNRCGTCERICKSECIDSKKMKVDMLRCVTCFNCNSVCTKGALKYKFALTAETTSAETASASRNEVALPVAHHKEIVFSPATTGLNRRSFFAIGATLASSVPLVALAQATNGNVSDKEVPITPPGSLNIERFKDLCTGCHLCVVQCPSHVLQPAGFEYGFGYLLKPHMSYKNSYCNYTCTVCSEICPSDAIKPITVEEKVEIQFGIAHFHKGRCIVFTDENDCGACSEHCPTQAVHMVPYKDTLTIPQVEPELCIGCGGCESICPVRPIRAIVIVANKEHLKAQKPKEEEVEKIEVNDFGF
jgi:polyferredoxin